MSITNEEKEALFKEFEARLAEKKTVQPQGYASGYNTLHNMEPAKDYFKKKYDQMNNDYDYAIRWYWGLSWSDWDKIRMLVCHAFGVSVVAQIPKDQLEAANDLAKTLIDLIFEQNYKTLNEKKAL